VLVFLDGFLALSILFFWPITCGLLRLEAGTFWLGQLLLILLAFFILTETQRS